MCCVAVFAKYSVGRFLHSAIELNVNDYIDVIDVECKGVCTPLILRRSIRMLVIFSCFFYAPFLFETLGSKIGITRAYWVLIVVPLVPIAMFIIYVIATLVIHALYPGKAPRPSSLASAGSPGMQRFRLEMTTLQLSMHPVDGNNDEEDHDTVSVLHVTK